MRATIVDIKKVDRKGKKLKCAIYPQISSERAAAALMDFEA